MSEDGLLLLDTHVWVWVLGGADQALGERFRAAILDASQSGRVRVAAISVWEVAMLESKGRLRLSMSIEEWIRRGLAAPGVQLAQLSPEIAIESTRLPGEPHGDPADRLLIATARTLGATLATCDREILRYGKAGHLRVLDASR
jgi:PIN domain nuclease of toxin-antitoxin system